MAQAYRLEVQTPSTAVRAAKTWVLTQDTGNIVSVEVELKRDKHNISNLSATIYDPHWDFFNAQPDPAFANVPVKFYLAKPDNPQVIPATPCFGGYITSLQAGYPGYDKTTVISHDKSIVARKVKNYRTYKGKTSLQIAQDIAKANGWSVSVAQGSITALSRKIDIGAELNDWDHIGRALAADGFEQYVDPAGVLIIRQGATLTYATVFQKDSPPVIKLDVTVNHVHGPGAGGDKKGPVPFDRNGPGTKNALTGNPAIEANKQNASERTHRGPVQSQAANINGTHSEDLPTSGWTNQAVQHKRRKDQATLECTALHDIGLQFQVILNGWGAKADGLWFIEAIRHSILGQGYASTTLHLTRSTSKGAANSAGIAFGGA